MTYVFIDIETDGIDHPTINRITCIGMIYDDHEIVICEENEKKLLEEFWRIVSRINSPVFVGFCSVRFDAQFIHIRSMGHDIEVSLSLKYPHIDIRHELSFYNYNQTGKLDDYAKFIGLTGKNGNGLTAINMWIERDLKNLKEYCLNDVRITKRLFERCVKSGVIKPKESFR